MKCIISAVVIATLVMIVKSHPICQQAVNATTSESCYANPTANVSFLNEWLSLHNNSQGINQLCRTKDSSIASQLLQLTSDLDDNSYHCLKTYRTIMSVPQSVYPSVDTVRGYFNVYLMHKVYVEYLVNLQPIGLWRKGWAGTSARKIHANFKKLEGVLKYNVKSLAQLLNNTCSGCTRNCTVLQDKTTSLISTMDGCKKSPLHSVVYEITQQSEELYKTIHNLKELSMQQQSDSVEMIDIPPSDVDNLCYCSAGTETV